ALCQNRFSNVTIRKQWAAGNSIQPPSHRKSKRPVQSPAPACRDNLISIRVGSDLDRAADLGAAGRHFIQTDGGGIGRTNRLAKLDFVFKAASNWRSAV